LRRLWRRPVRLAIMLGLLAIVLLGIDALCYQAALPITLDIVGQAATLDIGGQSLSFTLSARPTALVFAPHNPVVHEFQLDDTDFTNNLTLDVAYLDSIADTPYYRFQSWMRDLDGTSQWRDLRVQAGGQSYALDVATGSQFALPAESRLHITFALQRPETAMSFSLHTADGFSWNATIDRNDRFIGVTRSTIGFGNNLPITRTFFPEDPWPFVAMVVDFLDRTMLWALAVLAIVVAGDMGIIALLAAWPGFTQWLHKSYLDLKAVVATALPTRSRQDAAGDRAETELRRSHIRRVGIWLARRWAGLAGAIHPVGLAALALSFLVVLWIALVQYHAEPHIYDASAYLWGAKVYASGHLTGPVPAAADRFPGPFMVQRNDQRFTQYMPGTSGTLAIGVLLGVPWLVEPMLGTLALLGIGLIAAHYFDRRVATVAVLLGAISPFYSYLAASYMSHAIALFYLVWGWYLLLRFVRGGSGWNAPAAVALFGVAWFTRDIAVLFAGIVTAGTFLLAWRQLRREWRRWLLWGALGLLVAVICYELALVYNAAVTGNAHISARMLFSPDDKIGFGDGIGFYGKHTPAAGFVVLDQLLTSLAIDLFGWPFYLTLAFLTLPFLTLRARLADWLMLLGAVLLTGVWIFYFYHGIYLGPRFLYEALPFYLILTARGILILGNACLDAMRWLSSLLTSKEGAATRLVPRASVATTTVMTALLACGLIYYWPRQIILHQNFTGMPAGFAIDLQRVYQPPLHDAIVVTGDYMIYEYILFPLNDPYLHDDVIYALANNSADVVELHTAYPQRVIYRLIVGAGGAVSYVNVTP
jgi:hypothetical protein